MVCKFLTGKARLQQTEYKKIWRLLDNEVFKADDNTLYMAPRTMLSDNYTIPEVFAIVAGSPVDYDTRASHIHDEFCFTHEALIINLTEKELRDKGYLKFSDKKNMWICKDIPVEFLRKEKIGKIKANNLFYQCMEAAGVPSFYRKFYRAGVALNLNWYLYSLQGKIFELDLERIYEENYWDENIKKRLG